MLLPRWAADNGALVRSTMAEGSAKIGELLEGSLNLSPKPVAKAN